MVLLANDSLIMRAARHVHPKAPVPGASRLATARAASFSARFDTSDGRDVSLCAWPGRTASRMRDTSAPEHAPEQCAAAAAAAGLFSDW